MSSISVGGITVDAGNRGPQGPAGSDVPATTSTLGGIIIGDNLSVDENGRVSAEGGGEGGGFSAFYVAPNGYSGSTPAGYTLITENSSNVATVPLSAGYNIVDIAVAGIGTVNLVANAQPFAVDLVDGDGGLSTVTVNRVSA